MKNFLLGIFACFILVLAYGMYLEANETPDTTYRPAAATVPSYGDTNATSEAAAKQAVYKGCIEEAPEYASFCRCAADYSIDTWGVAQVEAWGYSAIPDDITQQILARCM